MGWDLANRAHISQCPWARHLCKRGSENGSGQREKSIGNAGHREAGQAHGEALDLEQPFTGLGWGGPSLWSWATPEGCDLGQQGCLQLRPSPKGPELKAVN